MRTRNLRVGAWVQVNNNAPGTLAGVRGQRGQVKSIFANAAEVQFEDTRYPVQARWLSPTDGPAQSPELAAFKDKLAKVAQQAKREHGWCEEINDMLRQLGVTPREDGKIRIVFEVPEGEFDAYVSDGDDVLYEIWNTFKSVLDDALSEERERWFVSATFVDREDE